MIRFLPYVLRSALRTPFRTLLTILAVGLAVFQVASLAAILQSRERAVAGAADTILVVSERDVY